MIRMLIENVIKLGYCFILCFITVKRRDHDNFYNVKNSTTGLTF